MKLKTITASIAALGLAATAAQAVQAAEPEQTQAAPHAHAHLPVQPDARRAVRDKQTGKLRAPTAEEFAAMQDAERAARKARGLPEEPAPAAAIQVQRHSNGMRSAKLGAEYLVTLKAQRTADGKLSVTHDKPGHEHPVSHDHLPTE